MLKIRELHVENEIIQESKDIANSFNEYFLNLPLKIQSNLELSTEGRWDYSTTFLLILREVSCMPNIVSNFNTNSGGVDCITTIYVKFELLFRSFDLFEYHVFRTRLVSRYFEKDKVVSLLILEIPKFLRKPYI